MARRGTMLWVRILRWMYLGVMAFVAVVVLTRGQWEAQLVTSGGTSIMHLSRAPIWNPPSAPSIEEFSKVFDNPPAKATSTEATILLKWDWMLLEFILHWWGAAGFFAVLYFPERRRYPDIVLHYGFCCGVSITVAAILCLLLWFAIGGWAPPWPLFFGIVGFVGGLLAAFRSFSPAE